MAVSSQCKVFGTLEDPGKLWDTSKHETPKAAEECVGEHPRSKS